MPTRRTAARALRPLLRCAVLLSAGLVAFVAPPPTSARAPDPATDRYEINDTPLDATAIEPATRYAATILGPADADWFKIRPYEPGWKQVFEVDRKQVDITAVRLSEECAPRSLQFTLFNAAGETLKSAAVYPGDEASVFSLQGDPNESYDLRVDTALDADCTQPVRYAFGAYPYTYIPIALGTGSVKFKDGVSCEIYGKKVKKIQKQLKRVPKRKSKQRKQLSKTLKTYRAKAKRAC